jgi:hypothetical protein
MHQHDVPFGVKEYIDGILRREINAHKQSKGNSKQGNDSKAGKQDATGRSGQDAAVDSGNDTGKGATTGVRKSIRESNYGERERPRSGAATYELAHIRKAGIKALSLFRKSR